MKRYILGIDQSTQATKALLFDEQGRLLCRTDRPHRQIIDGHGWVEHDPEEIYRNTLLVIRDLVEKAGIDKEQLMAMGISNQRETSVCWHRADAKPVCNAIVWQCARGAAICDALARQGHAENVRRKTGLQLSPYFPAAKLAWIFRHVPGVADMAKRGEIAVGTVDSWLVYRLTGGQRHQTDYSNASRTQLFNIRTLRWDEELLHIFGIAPSCMAEVTDSDGDYGMTDLEGWLDRPIPIRSVLGDSHGALFGQGCLMPGMVKATYGTGSSIMMNTGATPVFTDGGVVTSLAWKIGGQVSYVLEGNINYSGAVIAWLKDQVRLIQSPGETEALAKAANPADTTFLVPAFSGLSAPYWDSGAKAVLCGMTRTTGRNEIVRAALESIAFQIADIINVMRETSGMDIRELRVDGGATKNAYLMQFQSDIVSLPVRISDAEELSGIGAAYAAGIALGVYDAHIVDRLTRRGHDPHMTAQVRDAKYDGWRDALSRTLSR